MASASTNSTNKPCDSRRISCETVCSSNSSCFLQKRRPVHPLARPIRSQVTKTINNNVKQRVLSAKLLKIRSVQNQLNDANFHLAEILQENKVLKTLQKRQDKALDKYEGENADLPRLIKSHEEEIRVLQVKNKSLRKSLKEVTELFKNKDEELSSAREHLKHLVGLSKDKHLPEREKLTDQVEELSEKLKKSEDQINILHRKLMLETKNFKFKLSAESIKHKQCQKDLTQALTEIDRLTTLFDGKEKFTSFKNRKTLTKIPQRQAISMVSLGAGKEIDETVDNELYFEQTSTGRKEDFTQADVRLAPINHPQDESSSTSSSDILKSPSDNIKARLSAYLHDVKTEEVEKVGATLYKMNLSESDLTTVQTESIARSIYTISTNRNSRPNSSQRLEKLDVAAQRMSKVGNANQERVGELLGSYCSQVLNSVRDCGNAIEQHKETFVEARTETEKILETLKTTDDLDAQLRKNNVLTLDSFNIPDKDLEIVNKIWKDEYSFQKNVKHSNDNVKKYEFLLKSADNNGNLYKKDPDITEEDKNKLLKTFRAIDNGENVEAVTNGDAMQRKTKLMKELFGDDN